MFRLLVIVGICWTVWVMGSPEALPSDSGPTTAAREDVEAILFTPPPGWGSVDPGKLPGSVKVMVVRQDSDTSYPPSINLGMEDYKGSLKDYLKIVKAINESQHAEWKNLGTIHTEAGKASLSQVDMSTSWGTVRLMHVILVKKGQAYIMTAAALRDEFPRFYSEFFNAMRSLRFGRVAPDQLLETVYERATADATSRLDDN